jgi:hypothetical protein
MTPTNEAKQKGFHLKYQDFKKLEKIIEDYNFDEEKGLVDFNGMSDEEKDILWKIKTVIRNMESVRLRVNSEKKEGE